MGMGERWYEPELLRLKAEMLVAQPDPRVAGGPGKLPRRRNRAGAAAGGDSSGS